MAKLWMQVGRLYNLLKAWSKTGMGQVPCWTVILLLGLNITGCNNILPRTSPNEDLTEIPTPSLLALYTAQQHEIEHLKRLLAEKETQLRSLQARQQDHARMLQETTNQAVRAKVKLRRLATQSSTASTIAEVEVTMKNLQSFQNTVSESAPQAQAQYLLDVATASYTKGDYTAAMDHAAQSRELINMVANNRARKASDSRKVTVPFQIPIVLRVRNDSNLRREPRDSAAVVGILKKDSVLTAQAYQGDWLRVQTDDGRLGWLLNTLAEVQVGEPQALGGK